MNREILFRGKRIDSLNEWVQGYLFQIWDDVFILWGTTNGVPNQIQVDPKTVGQFTGLLDKDGTKIFEGDICKADGYSNPDRFLVEFKEGGFCCTHPILGDKLPIDINHFYPSYVCPLTVIGNIHDNPELLKAEV